MNDTTQKIKFTKETMSALRKMIKPIPSTVDCVHFKFVKGSNKLTNGLYFSDNGDMLFMEYEIKEENFSFPMDFIITNFKRFLDLTKSFSEPDVTFFEIESNGKTFNKIKFEEKNKTFEFNGGSARTFFNYQGYQQYKQKSEAVITTSLNSFVSHVNTYNSFNMNMNDMKNIISASKSLKETLTISDTVKVYIRTDYIEFVCDSGLRERLDENIFSIKYPFNDVSTANFEGDFVINDITRLIMEGDEFEVKLSCDGSLLFEEQKTGMIYFLNMNRLTKESK